MKHATPPRIFPRRNTLLNSCRALLGGSLLACGLHSGFAESPAPAAPANSGLLHAAPLPLVASPQLTEPLGAAWKIHHGQWTPENGELRAAEIPQEKHSAVLHHRVGLKNAVVELEFRLEGAGYFGVGCDGPRMWEGLLFCKTESKSPKTRRAHPKFSPCARCRFVRVNGTISASNGRRIKWPRGSTAKNCAPNTTISAPGKG